MPNVKPSTRKCTRGKDLKDCWTMEQQEDGTRSWRGSASPILEASSRDASSWSTPLPPEVAGLAAQAALPRKRLLLRGGRRHRDACLATAAAAGPSKGCGTRESPPAAANISKWVALGGRRGEAVTAQINWRLGGGRVQSCFHVAPWTATENSVASWGATKGIRSLPSVQQIRILMAEH